MMAVQWLGNVKQTGRGNLAKDIGEAVQPAVNVYADYLSKTRDREKAQAKEFITNFEKLPAKEQDAVEIELKSRPNFMKVLDEQYPGLLGENGKVNISPKYEYVTTIGTKVLFRSGTEIIATEMPEGIDSDTYTTIDRTDGTVETVNDRTGEVKASKEYTKIIDFGENSFTTDDGKSWTRTTTLDANGDTTSKIESAGINADLKATEMSIESNTELTKLTLEHQDEWKTKEFQSKKANLEFSVAEALRDQGNIETNLELTKNEIKRDQRNIDTKAKTDKEKFDAKLAEGARQFDVGTSLALYELSQTDEQFWAKMDHQVDMDMKRLNLDVTYKGAIMQDMRDKISIAYKKYDLSNVIANRNFITTNIELDQRQQQLDIALNESEWNIKEIKATMNQYVSVSALFAEDGKTIIGATGLKWDPETEDYVTEVLENVPLSVAKLMVQQQVLTLEGNEQDNIIKAQTYSGLAASTYGTIRNGDIQGIDSAKVWSSTAYKNAEIYAEGHEGVTAETAYGKILARAYNMNWIDADEIGTEELLYTDEAYNAFKKANTQWDKDNPMATKVEETTPSTNPNLMSGGLQTMSPEDNQFKSLLNSFLGNDVLYNNLKSAVTIPEQASNMTLEQALSDMNLSGPISRLEELAPGVLGGAGRRSAEYTKDVKNPTWENLIQLLGFEGGSE